MTTHRVTLIPGDGTGPELTEATRRVLEAAAATSGSSFDWDVQQAGVDVMETAGTPLPPETLESIKRNTVAIKGPITTPIGTGFRSVNVALRAELELYACLRPCKTYPGCAPGSTTWTWSSSGRTPRTSTRASSTSTTPRMPTT
jgi:isocitrate dehydrogenase (NAD+)